MTLPSLINDKQNKELQTQFKKVYSELNQASIQFYSAEGISIPEYARTNGPLTSLNKFLSYFKGATKVSNHTWNSTNPDGERTKPPYKLMPFKGSSEATQMCDISGYWIETGGRTFLINDAPASDNQNGPVLCVDINGSKLPNRYGKDNFLFIFTTDGLVIPMGMEHKNNISSGGSVAPNFNMEGNQYCRSTTSEYQQLSCAYYALADIHPQKEEKSYWKDFINEK